jgi:ATP-dependent Clp protease adaptor protein ClpS
MPTATAHPAPTLEPTARPCPRMVPRYHVVLLDDNEHTYDYVVEMLAALFHYGHNTAYRMACEVDTTGRVVVLTTVLEQAELKRDHILTYGPDRRLPASRGSMRALIEPASA